ncbi:MAG: ABC-F family ATP-binding cassette domain-containing protein [Bacteroidales bacterium]
MPTLLQADNISKAYGDILLFSDLSFIINEGKKIALIARNGAGKTSLLQMLAQLDAPDSGTIERLQNVSIGYLRQDPVFTEERTVFEEVFASAGGPIEVVRNYEAALSHPAKAGLEEAMAAMELHNAWDYETQIKQILSALKITQLNQQVATLSGGQKKRLALAITLIHNPDLLILDEPTNHLDLSMIEWLEAYLSRSRCTLFMVTHDRYFLDRVCNEILELDGGALYLYKGNYSFFLEKREERLNRMEAEADRARNLLRTEAEWMRRMPQARATKAKARIDAFYDLKERAARRPADKQVELNVKSARLGTKILECKGLSKQFGDKVLLREFSYTFARFEKVGIIGENGSGKTTFLNLLTGTLKPDAGTTDTGETVVVGYYTQQGIAFDPQQRVIDAVREIAEVVTLSDGNTLTVSQYLNFFLFPPEMQYTYIGKLSGGERRRLYLMTVLMKNPNFLILDEPTNDLDIATLQILEQYLQTFQGTLIIVSHDRFFMDHLVDHLFVFEGNGVIKDFTGNYSEYRDFLLLKEAEESRIEKARSETKAQQGVRAQSIPAARKKRSWKEERELEQLEKEMALLEEEKTNIEAQLNSGGLTETQLIDYSNRMGSILETLDSLTDRWLVLSES